MKYFLLTLIFFTPSFSFAQGDASLSFSPATGTYSIGDTFTVSVNVDTAGQAVNAVEGKISFNKDELELDSLSKEGSILESWTTEPTYSEGDGTISFGGGVKSFTGSDGKIFSITFHALKNTEAKVHFSTGDAILAADGQGTNILTLMNAGVYTLTAKEVIPPAESATSSPAVPMVLGASSSTEPKILVTSTTHPDENKWYNQKTAKFQWQLPSDANALRLSANTSSSSKPTNPYPPLHEKIVSNISDGVAFFHFQVKTGFGWSEPVTYRFQTDTEKPDTFQVMEASTTPNTADSFGFLFDAHDKTSGIEKYLIQIDGGAEMEWKDDGTHTYLLPEGTPGAHTLFVKALDFAGNFATSSAAFTLEQVNPPTITDFQEKILPGNALVIRGQADPNTSVSVWVSKDGAHAEESKITSGSDGRFTFVLNGKSEEGMYKIYAEERGRGVRSAPSASVLIAVSKPSLILFGKTALDYLSILIPLITLILLLLFILVYGFHRFKIFRAGLQKEIEEVETVSRKTFSKLRKEVKDEETLLENLSASQEKTPKTKKAKGKEAEAVKRLKKSIDNAEAEVEKEITKVKQRVKKPVKVKVTPVD